MARTVLWTQLVQALRSDGYDIADAAGPAMQKFVADAVEQAFGPEVNVEQQARELLAAEYERQNQHYEAGALRDGKPDNAYLADRDIQVALRVIERLVQP